MRSAYLKNLSAVMNSRFKRNERTGRGLGGVTIIIPNLNGRRHLPRCLKSLESTVGIDYEIVVADNGSSDDSVKWLRKNHPSVKLLDFGENRGFSGALMAGVRRSSRPLVCFLNNDTEVRPDWLINMVRALESDRSIAAVSATLLYLHDPGIINFAGGKMTWPGYGYQDRRGWPLAALKGSPEFEDTLFPSGAAMLISRRLLLECGGLDEELHPIYHEDVDLGWRLWIMGYRVVVSRKALVLHHEDGSVGPRPGAEKIAILGFRHSIRCSIKNYEFVRVLPALAALIASQLSVRTLPAARENKVTPPPISRFRAPLLVLRFFPKALSAARFFSAVCLWNLSRLGQSLRRRRFIQARRRRSDDELFARGLIRRRPWFPFQEDHAPGGSLPFDRLFSLKELYPAEDSALGRLSGGWGPVFERDELRGRALMYHARCRLRVEPGVGGRLVVLVGLTDSANPGTVRVICNREASGWTEVGGIDPVTVECDVKSGVKGELEVEIVVDANGYSRRRPDWWCAVYKIEFIPEQPAGKSRRRQTDVSVIIPTYNRCSYLRDCLAALKEQSLLPREVIVVDDGSTDGTSDFLADYSDKASPPFAFKYARQSNSGPAAARNRGLDLAEGDLIAFLGDDMRADRKWLERHVNAQRERGFSSAVCGFIDWDRSRASVSPLLEFVNLYGYQFNFASFRPGRETPFAGFYTSNLSLPAYFLSKNRFNEWFEKAAYEDIELGYRLCSRGMRIIYEPGCVVRHRHPMTAADFCRRQRALGEILFEMLGCFPEMRIFFPLPNLGRFHPRRLVEGCLLAADRILARLDGLNIRLPKTVYGLWLHSQAMAGVREARRRRLSAGGRMGADAGIEDGDNRLRRLDRAAKIHQIYYRRGQKKHLDGRFQPWDNTANPRPEWAELWVMLQAFENRSRCFSELTGFVSWKFHRKTGLNGREVFDFIASRPGYDCYIFNPLTLQTALFASVWDQGEYWHPGIKERAVRLLGECGIEADLDRRVDTFATTAYCNYFVAGSRFWDAYFKLMTRVFEALEKRRREGKGSRQATIHNGRRYRFEPFLVERFFGVVTRWNPDLKVLPYRYPPDRQSARTPGFTELISRADELKSRCGDDMNNPAFTEYLKVQRLMNDLLRRSTDAEKLLLL